MSFAAAARTRMLASLLTLSVAIMGLPFQATPATATVSTTIVISQIYGGGGNTGAQYLYDYVELFNRGTTTVSVSGWSIQYASATGIGPFGNTTAQITTLSGSIAPGRYLLVQEASGGTAGSPLPTPDNTDGTPINFSAAGGKVALVNTTTSLGCNGSFTSPCSASALASIVDLVGWDGANYFEGTGAAPTTTSTTAVFRNHGGCDETDQNAADFSLAAPAPRNSATPANVCGAPPPTLYALTVTNAGGGGVTSTTDGTTADGKINCGTACSGSYTAGASVVLVAAAATGASFKGWSGACAGAATTCSLTMSADSAVTAVFTERLTVTVTGTGSVTGNGINCPLVCRADVDFNTSVALTASASAPWAFTGWSGACNATSGSCSFTITAPANVSATFTQTDAAPAITVTSPLSGATDVALNAAVQITFSEPVTVHVNDWYTLSCTRGVAPAATTGGSGTTYTITPSAPFGAGQVCTVTVLAALVSDVDLIDPPDHPAADYAFSFTTAVRIHDLQGAQHISPFNGVAVAAVLGIVTARRTSSTAANNGLYIQDPNPDNDDRTSEGIFVAATSALLGTLAPGDAVTVSGTVTEAFGSATSNNLTVTEITASAITKTGTGTIAPTIIGSGWRTPPTTVIENDANGNVETTSTAFDPAQDGMDFYESLEGMLVKITAPVAAGPTRATFGELWVVGDGGAAATTRTPRGGIVVSEGDFNPERILVDDELFKAAAGTGPGCPSGSGAMPCVSTGATFVGDLAGVLEYAFGNYRVQLLARPTVARDDLAPEFTTAAGPNQLAVATFNVENLAPSDPDSKFATLAGLIVRNLQAPDVVALEEIQDNSGATDDGTTAANFTIGKLIAAIQVAGGPTYDSRSIDPQNDQDGGQPGGNIRVVYLFRADRGLSFIDRPGAGSLTPNAVVGTGSATRLQYSPGRIDPANAAWSSSRKPLAAEWTFNEHRFFTIANHFVSKGGDLGLFGKTQPPTRDSETKRAQQAAIVNAFVQSLQSADGNADIVVLGDLNDFQFSTTVRTLAGTRLRTLVDTLPLGERYSYNFEGNSQAIDHILVSTHLFANVPFDYDIVHVNAEFFVQASDHDPQVVRLSLPDATPPTITFVPADTTVEATTPAGAAVTFAPCTATDGVGVTSVGATPASGSVFSFGTTTVTCTASDAAGNAATATFQVTVVDTTPPSITAFAPLTVEATSPAGAAASFACTGSDLASTSVTIRYSVAPGSTFALGTTSVDCTATDAHGLSTTASSSVTVVDTTAPGITGTRAPAANAEGWNNTAVTVTFSCTDYFLASCTAPVIVSGDAGGQSVTGAATDTSGNTRSTTVGNINIDRTAPVVAYTGNAGTYTVDQTVHIVCGASDALSGIATNTCGDINAAASSFTLGTHTLTATATDVAGNTTTVSTQFTVVVTFESLCALTRRLSTQSGVANSLCQKLANAAAAVARGDTRAAGNILEAYRNEVAAQSGKAFTTTAAGLLRSLAGSL